MHNNFYFLRQLSPAIEKQIRGFTLVSCFSQSKDELIMEWNNGARSFFIKCHMQPGFSGLSFPETVKRARKNSVDLFNGFIMKRADSVRQFRNERSFAIVMDDGSMLIFSMHGVRANVIGWLPGTTNELFRNHLRQDLDCAPDKLDREIDFSREAFDAHQSDLTKLYFTFGKPVWAFLDTQRFSKANAEVQWTMIQETLKKLENPTYYLIEGSHSLLLTLLPFGKVRESFTGPLEALNKFVSIFLSASSMLTERSHLLSMLDGKIKQTKASVEKAEQRLNDLKHDDHYRQWADLIMTNLSIIEPGFEKIVVDNLYQPGTTVEIPLKKEHNAQQNAAAYYRKGRNTLIEIETLEKFIHQKQEDLSKWAGIRKEAEGTDELSVLKQLSGQLTANTQKAEKSLPYHEFIFKGFSIWVGKNAAANDELTLKYSFKDDLWFHAKDVAGSHVLLKHQAGKPFPKDVIEYAASLAAWHSKRKNESLCPVACTPKKFVRKRKGAAAGAVVVEREKVILVEPKASLG